MNDRYYRVVVADTEGGLKVAAPSWTIEPNTVRQFIELDSNDDQSLGDIGRILVKSGGWVALAYKDASKKIDKVC